ncbi:hypothetical protein PENDEC_c022G01179 [Penicillium decumbens]|uniref:Sialidase domain-containing protein n=1 Tax=Penicillium decumbens TaxID=69771 RepID=A0A1V6P1T9_PENDC|nr:hypothetical protein PENDEC_c022G01179 [Penicillium decumbens]
MLVVARDYGSTWSYPICLRSEKDPRRDGIDGTAMTTDNGRDALVMVFQTTTYGPFNVGALISYDDGATWQHRHEVFHFRIGVIKQDLKTCYNMVRRLQIIQNRRGFVLNQFRAMHPLLCLPTFSMHV